MLLYILDIRTNANTSQLEAVPLIMPGVHLPRPSLPTTWQPKESPLRHANSVVPSLWTCAITGSATA